PRLCNTPGAHSIDDKVIRFARYCAVERTDYFYDNRCLQIAHPYPILPSGVLAGHEITIEKMHINQLTQWDGEVNRRDYLLWGIILFAVKYNLDRVIGIFMGRNWFVWDYFLQADRLSVLELNDADRTFYLTLLFCSLPFIWVGTALCVKRLRNAGLP